MNDFIRLLHLSDVHFNTTTQWDADPCLRNLAQFVAQEVKNDRAPDLVVITGDLAHAGKAAEYALAKNWLSDALWPALTPDGAEPLPRDRLLLVPGNHDADRDRGGGLFRRTREEILKGGDQDALGKLLEDENDRDVFVRRYSEYLSFYGDWLGRPQTEPWWQKTIEIRGQRLHCVGLDSAWLAQGQADQGELVLGRWQIQRTVLHPDSKGADWRLALVHHPWDYLAEFDHDEVRNPILRHRHLVLRGHRHKGEAARMFTEASFACLEVAAGSVYTGRRHPNAFYWIDLFFDPRRVQIHFRTWHKNAWQVDRNQTQILDGTAEFPFDQDPIKTPKAQRGHAARPIPKEYYNWLRKQYGRLEMLGQDYEEARSVILSDVYVPAVADPAAQPSASRGSIKRQKKTPVLLLNRIDRESLYCLAKPGAGKSTFCRWAVCRSIPGYDPLQPVKPPEGFLELPPASLRTRLPLLVRLRDFWSHMDCRPGCETWSRAELEGCLIDWVNKIRLPGLSGKTLRTHLEAGTTFLVLDGLDEVPRSQTKDDKEYYPRALLVSGLKDALPEWERCGNRTLLTSRPYGLEDREVTGVSLLCVELGPLSPPLQKLFIERWFHTLKRRELAVDLRRSIKLQDAVGPLLDNPMLLTALCIVYFNGRRLPGDRFVLYQRIVKNVLFNRYPGEVQQRETVRTKLEAIAYGMHTGEGLDGGRLRPAPVPKATYRELETLLDRFAAMNSAYVQVPRSQTKDYKEFTNSAYVPGRVDSIVWLNELLTRSGLLRPVPSEHAEFFHLTFQEYLAADRIAREAKTLDRLVEVIRERWTEPAWHHTLLFLVSALVNYHDLTWVLDLLTPLAEALADTVVKSNPYPAVLLATALDEQYFAKSYTIPKELAKVFGGICLRAIADEIDLHSRQTLGLCLGRLGDPRIEDLRQDSTYVEVPAGNYICGERRETIRIVAPFRLARYPVTNSQYRAFIDDKGYETRQWWSDEGWSWKNRRRISKPEYWNKRGWNAPNQPVVGVSFWEAEACCHWAGSHLPTAREWEAAARGPTGCDYPWCGDWKDGICNSAEAGLNATSPVGLFPRSRQARLELEDLAGNVSEWCADDSDERDTAETRNVRGGAFDRRGVDLLLWVSRRLEPGARLKSGGFRCVRRTPNGHDHYSDHPVMSDSESNTSRTASSRRADLAEIEKSTTSEVLDCFLSHNTQDKPSVRTLAVALRERGISVWLDEDCLRPGVLSQPLLEAGIRASRSVAVLVGASGFGPWQQEEVHAALSLAVKEKKPVIPVLLADAPIKPDLPILLIGRTWVDMRLEADPGNGSALDKLIWGITGKHPNRP